MNDEHAMEPPSSGTALLERAINYTLGNLHSVTPAAMAYATPCRDWDLQALLGHLDDSLTALHEAVDIGQVALDASDGDSDPVADPVLVLRNRASRLLGAWTGAGGRHMVSVAGTPLTADLVTCTGAIEVAAHGWDIAQACGRHRPIPSSLAQEMLQLAPLVVTDADRPARFAPPNNVSPLADPGDRLIAFLGRQP